MVAILKDFIALEEPHELGSFGWYVGCIDIRYDEYYLHDDGVIYDTCAPQINNLGVQVSTGWFKSEVEAYIEIRQYYNKRAKNTHHGAGTDKAGSQVMEFE